MREIIARDGLQSPELLRLAASIDQLSAHSLGETLVRAASEAGLSLITPSNVHEEPRQGIEGVIDGRRVAVGSRAFLRTAGVPADEVASAIPTSRYGSGEAHVLVGVDGRLSGVIVMADELRRDADQIVAPLRNEGTRHVALVSGDRRSVAERVGRTLGQIGCTRSSHPRTSSRSCAVSAPTISCVRC